MEETGKEESWRAWGCRRCQWMIDLWYASGGHSFRCTHPKADKRTTRDVRILEACPAKEDKNTK